MGLGHDRKIIRDFVTGNVTNQYGNHKKDVSIFGHEVNVNDHTEV